MAGDEKNNKVGRRWIEDGGDDEQQEGEYGCCSEWQAKGRRGGFNSKGRGFHQSSSFKSMNQSASSGIGNVNFKANSTAIPPKSNGQGTATINNGENLHMLQETTRL
ncbi:hypothetical protein NE237_001805 [Protea cynaroides]|uniref:Uncharacterized protein n=1 Tax=Protea cynaroides TaxID=273540 RepID=A0A9Q0KU84_9MAGN|nr:hypothetical protein NE237_001805 [Protea cynaroides]